LIRTAADSIVKGVSRFCQSESAHYHAEQAAKVLPWRQYAALMELLRKRQKYFLDEANVARDCLSCRLLRDLIASGDVIRKVEAFSRAR